jgi:hypothetical protein
MAGPKLFSFSFKRKLLEKLWLDYEIASGVEDVIIAIKQIETRLDIIKVLGVIADALKKTETLAIAFVQDEKVRDDIAGRLDEVFHFGGLIGATIVERFDRQAFKRALDWAAEEVEVKEE